MPLTASQPKTFTPIAGKRILDWTLDAFQRNGLGSFVFVGGYLKHLVEAEYPQFTMVENPNWPDTNMLHSLACARDFMAQGFYSTYTDTLYRDDAVASLKESPYDITLVMDTLWRERYRFRSQHPESDGEKMITDGERVVRISREIRSEEASGEFTGVLRMTRAGAAQFLAYYDGLLTSLGADGIFTAGRPFRHAYVIHQLDQMIQEGIEVHCVSVPGEYHEIDTLEDHQLASRAWW